MSCIAALPMYDFPHLRAHTDALWQGLHAAFQNIGFETSSALTRNLSQAAIWHHPELGFAQTCGLPYVQGLRGHTSLIGTPNYGIIPDKPGWYHSVIIARISDTRTALADFAGARFAYNSADSQSGLYAMMFELQAFGSAPFFGHCLKSGAHMQSAIAVAEGRADIAAIDAVSWRYLLMFLPEASKLKELQTTTPNPGLPYISSNDIPLANAVETAIDTLPATHKKPLGLKGFWRSQPEDYDIIETRAKLAAPLIAAHGIA